MRTHVIVSAVCLIVGVILGALLGAWFEGRRNAERNAVAAEEASARTVSFEAEMSELRNRVDLLQIHLRLGRIALEADRQDYGTAAEGATAFFDDLSQMAERTQGDEKVHAAVQQALGARDEVIAGLATADPAATQRLKQLYLEFFNTAY